MTQRPNISINSDSKIYKKNTSSNSFNSNSQDSLYDYSSFNTNNAFYDLYDKIMFINYNQFLFLN